MPPSEKLNVGFGLQSVKILRKDRLKDRYAMHRPVAKVILFVTLLRHFLRDINANRLSAIALILRR